MKKKNLILIIAAIALMTLGLTACAGDRSKPSYLGAFRYTVTNNGVTITKLLNAKATKAIIPSYVYGYPVTSIGDYAFDGCSEITSVTIPNSVESIGDYAFDGCKSLTNMTIPDSVTTIGKRAFYGCESLSSVTIGSGVTTIGERAFYNCSSLSSVTIGSGVKTIGERAFDGCKSLTNMTIPNSVKTIGDSAFRGCSSLTSVTIGSGVTTIERDAFDDCKSLTSVTIGYNVTSIGYGAFDGCLSLNAVHITSLAAWCNISFGDHDANPLYYAHKLYLNGELITDLVIPNSVTSIGNSAFAGCSSLSSVKIPNSVKTIGDSAFMGCTSLNAVHITDLAAWCSISFGRFSVNPLLSYAHNLYLKGELITDLVIPNSVTTISDSAFYGCSSLTSVTIPNSVKSIGDSAFYYCSKLSSVTIGNSVKSIGDSAFYYCKSLNAVHITSLAAWCNISFGDRDANPLYYAHKLYLNGVLTTDLVIPDSVTSIGSYTFYNCSSLTNVTIPNSVTSIGYEAFYNCSKLSSVTIGRRVTSIGEWAFYGCYRLVEVYNLSSLNIVKGSEDNGEVGYYAKNVYTPNGGESKLTTTDDGFVFIRDKDGVYYLVGYNGTATEIVLPDDFNGNSYSINDFAFRDCSSLTSVTIPDSVTSIGRYAFNGCESLSSVTIGSGVITIGYGAFYDCSSLNAVNITDLAAWCNISFKNYAANPLYYAHNLYLNGELITDLVIPDSVATIGDYAFYNCSALTSVTIGSSVTSIGGYAFEGCSSLTSITIPNSVMTIGWYAFEGCESLSSVTIPNSVTLIGRYAFYGCSNIEEVFYAGSVSDWAKIEIDGDNYYLTNATRYYYSETQPTTSGNYWHYGDDGVTVVKW